MAQTQEIGVVKRIPYQIEEIEWEIPNFFTVTKDIKSDFLASSTFLVSGVLWHLRLWPCCDEFKLFLASQKCYASIYLPIDDEREYSLEYAFGLKKCDGTVKFLVDGIIQKNEAVNNNNCNFIKKTQLLARMSEFLLNNVLTIVCAMKWKTQVSQSITQRKTVLDCAKVLKLIKLDKLSENFKELFDDKETCDVTFKVKDKEYKAHRSVLIARSSVFAATFKHDTLERQTGLITISDCDPDSFQKFLDYLYSGKLEELSPHSAVNLYYTSNKYDVEELKEFCVEYLMQCLTVETICETAMFVSKYNEAQLFSVVQNFFNKNFIQIFLTSEWKDLMRNDCELGNKLLEGMSKMKLGRINSDI